MKRILIFNDSLAMGGTEVLLVDMLNHLATRDCKITLLLPQYSADNVLLDKIAPGVEIKYLYRRGDSFLKKKIGESLMIFFPHLFVKLKRVREADYDMAVCFKESFYAKMFAEMKIPNLLWVHNILYKRHYEIHSFKERLSILLNKKQLKSVQDSYVYFDKVICVSDACKQTYIDVLYDGIEPKQDIRVLYNAVDMEQVIIKSKQQIPPLENGTTNFVLITRISAEKRTDRLLNGITKLQEDGYTFHAYIIGDGTDSEEMKSIVQQCQISDKVTLMGRLENPFPYVLQSNWLLCVSQRESFSLVLLEAMALKTPVITTDCGGPADIVDHGRYGILVDNSTEGVYQGMKMVLDDKSLSFKYSAKLDECLARFDYKHWLQRVYDLMGV